MKQALHLMASLVTPPLRLAALVTLTLGVVGALLLPSPAEAATGTLYFTSATTSPLSGTTLSVGVRETSTDPVNAVQLNLTYPADTLELLSIVPAMTFPAQAHQQVSAGTIAVARGVTGVGVTGDNLVATLNFRITGAAGASAVVSVAPGSALVRGADQVNVLTGSPRLALKIPAPAKSTKKTTVKSPTPTPASTPQPTALPMISQVNVTDHSDLGTAVVTWITDRPATSLVRYGVTTTYGLTAQANDLTTDHQVTLNSALLVPGEHYHLIVSSVDAAGLEGVGTDQALLLKGYGLTVTVTDAQGAILPGRAVALTTPQGMVHQTTDAAGRVVFRDVMPGKHQLTITPATGPAVTVAAVVKNDTAHPEQATTVKVAAATTVSERSWLYLALGAGVLLLLGVVALLGGRLLRRRLASPPSTHPSPAPPPIATVPSTEQKRSTAAAVPDTTASAPVASPTSLEHDDPFLATVDRQPAPTVAEPSAAEVQKILAKFDDQGALPHTPAKDLPEEGQEVAWVKPTTTPPPPATTPLLRFRSKPQS